MTTTAVRTRRSVSPRRALLPLALPVVLLIAWWFASAGSVSPFFPPLPRILESFFEDWLATRVFSDVLPSLGRMLGGFAVAAVVGIGLGALLGRLPLVARALNPVLQFGRTVPATALVPVSIVLFGIGDAPKVLLIAFVSVFPILLNTIDGVRSVDSVLEDVARSYRLTRAQRLLTVQLPVSAPQVLAGLRIALSLAFVMMIVSELFAATNGIGYVTLQAQQSFQISLMWSGMLLLGILGVLVNGLFVLLERRLLRWYTQNQER